MTLIESPVGANVPLLIAADSPNRQLYEKLLKDVPDANVAGRRFLRRQLARAADLPNELPTDAEQLLQWSQTRCAAVAREYAEYLASRQQGAPRRYFHDKSHALYFLQHVAPTKEVDGAWLAGVLKHWRDVRFDGLIDTYLEELGDGVARQNHVVIYRKLLSENACDDPRDLSDEHFLQGAVQLALGHCSDDFLPEVIGYNLGYEQLPLHLLISAYELGELGIDPHYFRLHVTIDNASTGHARKAVQSLLDLMPVGEGRDEFYRRVTLGYRLNDLGIGSTEVIQDFDLHREVVSMLERKALFGQHMHSDYCRVENRTINQWLSTPGQMSGFLVALERKGWIKRGAAPEESRFWKLIEGSEAAMFGVFSGYEKQLLSDWIADGSQDSQRYPRAPRKQAQDEQDETADPEIDILKLRLADLTPADQLNALIPWLSPRCHWRPAGLYATRRFILLRAQLR